MSDPWSALDAILDGPLHPGGSRATADLLDRAEVGAGTRLLDIGCGAGDAVALARRRDARAWGLDRDPSGSGTLRGDLQHLPVTNDAVDVVLAECSLCLAADLGGALAEACRCLVDDGRLALSDVIVDGDIPNLPAMVTDALCLDRPRDREYLIGRLEATGFSVREIRDHRQDLLAMRDDLAERVDYEALLTAMGRPDLVGAVRDLERAVEDGRVGYVSIVADTN